MELELRHLRVLCAIADTGSVGRAAVLLGASQPATSTQLRRIERHLGAPLFERTAVGVAPTCFGVEVVAAARDLLTRADCLGRRPAAPGEPPARSCAWPRPSRRSCRDWSPGPGTSGPTSASR